jgi:hypothetical protein
VDARGDPEEGHPIREGVGFSIPHRSSWHGTMTSCVCAGNGFMSVYRYAGLAPDARVVLVKTGNLRNAHIRERDIARALRWVAENAERFNVRIVNISLGGDHPCDGRLSALDALVEEACRARHRRGVRVRQQRRAAADPAGQRAVSDHGGRAGRPQFARPRALDAVSRQLRPGRGRRAQAGADRAGALDRRADAAAHPRAQRGAVPLAAGAGDRSRAGAHPAHGGGAPPAGQRGAG